MKLSSDNSERVAEEKSIGRWKISWKYFSKLFPTQSQSHRTMWREKIIFKNLLIRWKISLLFNPPKNRNSKKENFLLIVDVRLSLWKMQIEWKDCGRSERRKNASAFFRRIFPSTTFEWGEEKEVKKLRARENFPIFPLPFSAPTLVCVYFWVVGRTRVGHKIMRRIQTQEKQNFSIFSSLFATVGVVGWQKIDMKCVQVVVYIEKHTYLSLAHRNIAG